MHKHITHSDDCGCLSQRKDAEIAALTALCLELADALAEETEAQNDFIRYLMNAESTPDYAQKRSRSCVRAKHAREAARALLARLEG